MSAICGIFHLDGRLATRDEIAAMSAALAHRGTDRNGIWVGNDVALAHRLHTTTPESVAEIQPVLRSQGDLVLVADARIDNRDELISSLRAPLSRWSSDNEIILAAYAKWGRACVDHLVGDFSFAIWDARNSSLFCARDPMGVKPFYYFRNDRFFAFATELKSLFTLAEVRPEIDSDAVALFMGRELADRTHTMYRDLLRLPAAHGMIVERDRATLWQFWSPDSAPDVRHKTDDDFAEAFRDIFAKAVSARSRSAKAIGATLSGGLDSSSVVCMSRCLQSTVSPGLHTFSVIFPSLPEQERRLIDERSFVDTVVQSGGVSPHFVRGDQISPLRDVQRILWHLDEPFFAPNLYLHWGMYEAANEAGVRVLLDGFDGDSAVSHGFGRLTGLTRAGRWDALEAELLAFSAHHAKSPGRALDNYVLPHLGELARSGRYASWLRGARNISRRFGLSRTTLALNHGIRPVFEFLSRRGTNSSAQDDALLQPSLAAALRQHIDKPQLADSRRVMPSEREAHVQGLSQPLYQLTLEIADKSAAAFGIEPRYPFFDRRLIEFCVGLPEEQKFGGGWPRLLFRRAMHGVLPPAIQWRTTKSNLTPNFHRQFRAVDARMAAAVDETALAPFLRVDRLRALRSRYRGGTESETTRALDLTLFRTIVLGEWLSQFADRSRRARSEAGALSPEAA